MHRTPTSITRTAIASALLALVALVPLARANDLSNSPCTANDVEIIGGGIVVNEPCVCPPGGFFDATVQFTVRNNTSTGRYCITLHLVPDGIVLTQPTDVVLHDTGGSSTAPGKHDTIMFGTIPHFACSTGQVCFGQAGVTSGKCSPGLCTTIAWNTSPGAAGCSAGDQSPSGGQCRHQQVCVIGYGARLACTSGCGVQCSGGSATLQACVDAPTSRGPFTLVLSGSDGSSATQTTFGDASGTACLNFNVSPTQSPTTTYTLTVTDKNGCTRTAQTSLGVRAHPSSDAGVDQAKCSATNVASFTLAGVATNGTGVWRIVSGSAVIADTTSATSSVSVTGSATLRWFVSNAPCSPASDDVTLTVNTAPTSNAGNDQAKCSEGTTTAFTLAGQATNGTGKWSVISGPAAIANVNSLTSGVTFTGTGTATLRLTVTSNATPACTSAQDDVVLTVNANPTANAGPDQSLCSGGATTTFTLAGTASNGTSTWTVLSGPAQVTTPSDLHSTVTFTGGGTALLRLATVSGASPSCGTAADTVALNVTVTDVTITPPASPGCNGVLSYTASVNGGSGCSFTWTIDGQAPATFAGGGAADDARIARTSGTGGSVLEFRALDNACHTIAVSASCPGAAGTCTGGASTTAKQCVGAPASCN